MRDDWTESTPNIKRFEHVAFLKRGHDLPSQSRLEGDYPVVASNGSVGYHNQCIGPVPGLVTGRSGTIGKVMYLETGYWPLNTTLYVTDFMGNDERFVALTLETMRLGRFAGGTTVPSLDRKVFRGELVFAPPLSEQRRIVDVVSSVDAYIDALQQQVDAACTARDAVGEDAVNSGYPIAKLSDIGRVITGSTPPTKRLEYWEPAEVDFVTAGDFGAQLLIKTASRMVSREGANVSRLLSSHSVMQVCIGATIGKVGYVSHEVVTNQQINSIVGLEELDAYFVALMLSTNEMQATIRDRAGTTTLPIISKSGWGELSIPWPDISVRESISVLAKSIDEFISETNKAVVEAKSLRSGLLSDLLSGEHEIPVSYDELLGAA